MTLSNKKQSFILLCGLVILLFLPENASSKGIRLEPWKIIQTRFTIIRYKSTDDLKELHKKVKYGPQEWNVSPVLVQLTEEQIIYMVRKKVDAVFLKAQQILDMKKRFNPVTLIIYPDKPSLNKAFESIYSAECKLRAWYRFKNNTAYFNVQDIHTGMVAHELAHAIIDHYLTVRPPRNTAEILARYVDTHLDRGFVN